MIHVQVALVPPFTGSYVPQSCTYKHQCSLSVWECPYDLGSPLDFSVESFECVVGADSRPVFRWKTHIRKRLLNAFFDLLSGFGKLHTAKFLCYICGFLQCCSFVLLCMNGFQHLGYDLYLLVRHYREDIPVEVYRAALILCS